MMSPPWSTRDVQRPNWIDSLLFVALMSGPPKFRDRDPLASLAGEIDLAVLFQIGVWTCGGLWVLARVYPSLVKRGVVPPINPAQTVGALFIAALTLSIWDSPGMLMTAFTLGQFAVMLAFVWMFTHRFGTASCLKHMFIGVSTLALMTAAAVFLNRELVGDASRIRGDVIADTGSVAVIGLVLCLSNVPPLRGPMFWSVFSLFGALLFASRTRTAYAGLLVFLAIGILYGRNLRVRKLVLPLAALTFGMFVLDAFTSTTDYLVRERESIGTMSDRIPLWEYLTSAVLRDAPITGLGYYAASRVVAAEYNPVLGNAHSVFFEVLVGGGMLGAALYLLLCATLTWFAVHLLWVASGHPRALAAVGLFFVSLLMGVTTPAGLQPGPLGFVFWSSTALLPQLWREAARARLPGTTGTPASRDGLMVTSSYNA